jgi:LmbE family N-acetylglucosaminyl deacetylase
MRVKVLFKPTTTQCRSRPPLNILVLSPHRDDAAFSLSLSIDHWISVGHRVTLLNIFTRSLYAPYSDADTVHHNARLAYVSALRKREDEAFLASLPGMTMIDLNVEDAPIRLSCDSAIVCDMEVDPNDPAMPEIREALISQVGAVLPVDALVVPLALGHHVDHRIVRDAVLPFTTHLPTAFYEDLPYATREGVRTDFTRFLEDASTRLHEALHPVLIHGTRSQPTAFKLKIATLYASQIEMQLAETIANFSHRYQGAERLWSNDLWLKNAVANKLSTTQRVEEAKPLSS